METSLITGIGAYTKKKTSLINGRNDPQFADALKKVSPEAQKKTRAKAQEFEAVFLNSMFSTMFTDVKGDGPMGGSGATGVWRSFMIDEYSKSFARAGGVGIADQVYGSLLAHQEAAQK